MIRTAKSADADHLRQIWQACFGDADAYINFFFDNAFDPEKTLVFEAEGAVCSMLFLLDCSVWIGGEEYPASYLYAAATLPAYRSRGIMGRMIRRAGEFCRDLGKDFIILVPAEPGLFDYYARFGFRPYFYDAAEEWPSNGEQGMPAAQGIEEEDVSALEQIRRAVLRRCGGMMWNGAQFSYALREHRLTGGQLFQTEDGYALYHCTADECTVDELMVLPGAERAFQDALRRAIPATRFRVVHPCGAGQAPRARGMLWDLNGRVGRAPARAERPYIGLTLG